MNLVSVFHLKRRECPKFFFCRLVNRAWATKVSRALSRDFAFIFVSQLIQKHVSCDLMVVNSCSCKIKNLMRLATDGSTGNVNEKFVAAAGNQNPYKTNKSLESVQNLFRFSRLQVLLSSSETTPIVYNSSLTIFFILPFEDETKNCNKSLVLVCLTMNSSQI